MDFSENQPTCLVLYADAKYVKILGVHGSDFAPERFENLPNSSVLAQKIKKLLKDHRGKMQNLWRFSLFLKIEPLDLSKNWPTDSKFCADSKNAKILGGLWVRFCCRTAERGFDSSRCPSQTLHSVIDVNHYQSFERWKKCDVN